MIFVSDDIYEAKLYTFIHVQRSLLQNCTWKRANISKAKKQTPAFF